MKLSTGDLFKHIKSDICVEIDDFQLKQLQELLLGILKDVIYVCEKYGITYSLGGGSALGAIRHKGFIPWDDDIDLNMPREAHDKFVPLFVSEFKDKYWVHTPENTENYNLLYTRIRLKGTSMITRDDFENPECGVLLDIFVIENTFDNYILRVIHGFGSLALGLLHSSRKFYRDKDKLLELIDDNMELVKAVKTKAAIGFLVSFLSMQSWTRMADKWHKLCKNKNTKYVSIPVGRKHFFGELYLRDDICKMKKEIFEGVEVNCPHNTDMYLTRLYGDYMVLPDDTQKEKHVYIKPFIL